MRGHDGSLLAESSAGALHISRRERHRAGHGVGLRQAQRLAAHPARACFRVSRAPRTVSPMAAGLAKTRKAWRPESGPPGYVFSACAARCASPRRGLACSIESAESARETLCVELKNGSATPTEAAALLEGAPPRHEPALAPWRLASLLSNIALERTAFGRRSTRTRWTGG